MEMTFIIMGNPVAQGRPKFFRRGNFVGVYDPGKSKSWKEAVKWQIIEQSPIVLDGPLDLNLKFFLPRPKTLPKRILHHTKKPDVDNLAKAIKDAMKGICYKDDSQVCRLSVSKVYGTQTGVEIILREIQ